MPTYTLKTRSSAPALRSIVLAALGMVTGRGTSSVVDRRIIDGIKLRIAAAFFAKVKAAYVVKARGGTDEAGISWAWLSLRYLAYQRRGVLKKLSKKDKQTAPVNYESTALYKSIYRSEFARLSAAHSKDLAKAIAKRNALIRAQVKSGQTKIAAAATLVPGADYEILRDTGVLLNSLSPGVVSSGDTPSYNAKPGQIIRTPPGELICGTNVAYAAAHHHGSRKRGLPARPLWPEPNHIPTAWLEDFAEAGRRGLEKLLLALLRRAA